MNKVILMGRLTKDADIHKSNDKVVTRFSLAVDRTYKAEGQPSADFINCVAFGKIAEFCENYAKKGTKFVIEGRIQTGSYEKNGTKVYTTDIVVEHMEFAESKRVQDAEPSNNTTAPDDNFIPVPDEYLPFN